MDANIAPDFSKPRLARLANRGLMRVEGPDWRSFLHNLLTHDVEALEPERLRFTALLTPQGKFLHDMFVLPRENGALLDVQLGHREALIKRLCLYRLRAKLAIDAEDGAVFAAWGADPGPGWAADPRLPALGWRRLGAEVEAGAPEDDYDAHRLALGVPDPGRDCTPDKTYPIEADFDLLNGIDFKKGCFIGQETTSRMHRRGTVKTRMAPIAFEGAAPAFGPRCWRANCARARCFPAATDAPWRCCGWTAIAGAALTVDGRPVRADLPAWMAPAAAAAGLPQEVVLPSTRA
jgi:folate-binding protein YgfZ